MNKKLHLNRINFLEDLLPYLKEHGWTLTAVQKAGKTTTELYAIFPSGISDIQSFFHQNIANKLQDKLEQTSKDDLRIRDIISTGSMAYFELIAPHTDLLKTCAAFNLQNMNPLPLQKRLWTISDIIWTWAGDTSTDYNHYTKRLLLSAVLASTTLYVFSQDTYSADTTHDFLNRRIENVLQINKFKAKIKKIGL